MGLFIRKECVRDFGIRLALKDLIRIPKPFLPYG